MSAAPFLLAAALWAAPESTAPVRTVFLMHGILNARVSMKRIERALERRGFEVVNLGYPSRSKTIEEHARWLDERVRQRGRGELYFVGHSLGSIILRCYLDRFRPPSARRFVMISPPNHGSGLADKVAEAGVYKLIYGDKAGRQLRASATDFWRTLPAPPIEFGIITGGRGDGRGFSALVPGDDDGTVSVEEARLEGAADFAVLPYQHTTILLRKAAIERTVRFLETGRF